MFAICFSGFKFLRVHVICGTIDSSWWLYLWLYLIVTSHFEASCCAKVRLLPKWSTRGLAKVDESQSHLQCVLGTLTGSQLRIQDSTSAQAAQERVATPIFYSPSMSQFVDGSNTVDGTSTNSTNSTVVQQMSSYIPVRCLSAWPFIRLFGFAAPSMAPWWHSSATYWNIVLFPTWKRLDLQCKKSARIALDESSFIKLHRPPVWKI